MRSETALEELYRKRVSHRWRDRVRNPSRIGIWRLWHIVVPFCHPFHEYPKDFRRFTREVVGLRWRNVHADSITIDERYTRGDWGAPKSSASNATVAVNQVVIERIERLKTLEVIVRAGSATRRVRVVKSGGPDDLVFQSLLTGAPMRDNNILVRHIKPAAKALGIGWVNWQVLRRSFATWLKLAGADIKDAQALMRHSRASTTLDIYQQFVPESQRRVVDNLGRLMESARVN
jgi:integrase